jgi:ATP-dependent Clp protease ATP-binding subunit ClpC
VIFRHLEKKDLKLVVDFELAKIRERLQERGFELTLTSDAKDFLIKKGTNLDYGARPLRRALENFVEDPLSEELLQGRFEGKNKIMVDAVRNDAGKLKSLKFESDFVPPPEPPEPEEPVGVGAAEEEASNGDSDE